jgi:hypothetical protein
VVAAAVVASNKADHIRSHNHKNRGAVHRSNNLGAEPRIQSQDNSESAAAVAAEAAAVHRARDRKSLGIRFHIPRAQDGSPEAATGSSTQGKPVEAAVRVSEAAALDEARAAAVVPGEEAVEQAWDRASAEAVAVLDVGAVGVLAAVVEVLVEAVAAEALVVDGEVVWAGCGRRCCRGPGPPDLVGRRSRDFG